MRKVLAMIAAIGVALLAACGAPDTGGGAGGSAGAPADLSGTTWLLTGIDAGQGAAAPATGRGELTFSFAEGRLGGSAGCNRLSASYTQSGAALSVGPIMSTKMACPEPLMQQESAVGAILMAAERAAVAGDTLTISAADGRSLVFSRA